MEDDLYGRQPQWNTTLMEDNLNGRHRKLLAPPPRQVRRPRREDPYRYEWKMFQAKCV